MKTPKNKLAQGLRDYLECEVLLSEFFDKANFCLPHCISRPLGKYNIRTGSDRELTSFPGNVGCCPESMFNFTNYPEISNHSLLEAERVKKYGTPIKKKDTCDYHTPEGCAFKDHKTPTCLGYICPDFLWYLDEKFGINYSKYGIIKNLELILAGKKPSGEVREFKETLKGLVTAVDRN